MTYLYHVTSRANLPSIRRLGLIPNPSGSPYKYGVYLYADIREARRSALCEACRHAPLYEMDGTLVECEGGHRVILRVDVPRDLPLFEDPADYAPACHTPGRIPPEWIVEVLRAPRTREGASIIVLKQIFAKQLNATCGTNTTCAIWGMQDPEDGDNSGPGGNHDDTQPEHQLGRRFRRYVSSSVSSAGGSLR